MEQFFGYLAMIANNLVLYRQPEPKFAQIGLFFDIF